MPGRAVLVLSGALLVALLALSLRFFTAEAEPAAARSTPSAPSAEDRSLLAEALQAEVEARRQLAREVQGLRHEVARLTALMGMPATESEPSGDASDDESLEPDSVSAGRAAFFDEELLVGEGLAADEATRLGEAFEELELERLYLADRAVREGWAYTMRYRRELRALENSLRADLGDEAFDYMLYGAGRNNRVLVADLLARSPASRSGVEAGDIILRYDERPVFSAQELRIATTGGQAGAATRLEVFRNGRVVTLSVPRGPLGVRLIPTRGTPGL